MEINDILKLSLGQLASKYNLTTSKVLTKIKNKFGKDMTDIRLDSLLLVDGQLSKKEQLIIIYNTYPKSYKPLLKRMNITEWEGEELYLALGNKKGVCAVCDKDTAFKQISHGYYEYCSCSCRAKDKESFKNGTTPNAIKKRKDFHESLTEGEKTSRFSKIVSAKREKYGQSMQDMDKQLARLDKEFIEKQGQYTYDLCMSSKLQDMLDNLTFTHTCELLDVTVEILDGFMKRHNIIKPKGTWYCKSRTELGLLNFIKSNYKGKIRSGDRKLIAPYELDIFLPELKIAIEFCGSYWHSPDNKQTNRDKKYHQMKWQMCADKGVTLITIFDTMWSNKKDIVKGRLLNMLGMSERIYARKTSCINIDSKTASKFINDNHIQGFCGSSDYVGMFLNGELIGCMTFKKPRYDKSYDYEIIRSCTKIGLSVVGGVSKMLSHFKKSHAHASILSYSDNAYGLGKTYEKIGFTFHSVSPASYRYFNTKDSDDTLSRSQCMKHILVRQGYDENKTEKEIMNERGYYRIYDCGVTKWVYNNTK